MIYAIIHPAEKNNPQFKIIVNILTSGIQKMVGFRWISSEVIFSIHKAHKVVSHN